MPFLRACPGICGHNLKAILMRYETEFLSVASVTVQILILTNESMAQTK